MVVARVGQGLEAEAALDLQAGMAAEVADVPKRVRLAFTVQKGSISRTLGRP